MSHSCDLQGQSYLSHSCDLERTVIFVPFMRIRQNRQISHHSHFAQTILKTGPTLMLTAPHPAALVSIVNAASRGSGDSKGNSNSTFQLTASHPATVVSFGNTANRGSGDSKGNSNSTFHITALHCTLQTGGVETICIRATVTLLSAHSTALHAANRVSGDNMRKGDSNSTFQLTALHCTLQTGGVETICIKATVTLLSAHSITPCYSGLLW